VDGEQREIKRGRPIFDAGGVERKELGDNEIMGR